MESGNDAWSHQNLDAYKKTKTLNNLLSNTNHTETPKHLK